ncbi:MAG: 30S ribosomal protein S8 [Myxococcales bacterium]|nr:30S ribosomal protein S8 [Myxococcales bacterium]MCB9579819.1 30S ribosomal protein S8 [Polyangiaceae bacterium]
MMTDPISDMLARIRNAALARHEMTHIPHSRLKKSVAEILKAQGYIADVRSEKWGPQQRESITVVLKYGRDRKCAFQGLRRVSKPGRRVYVGHDSIPRVLSGLGVAILSTPQGLMTDADARKNKVGGEVLCEVW